MSNLYADKQYYCTIIHINTYSHALNKYTRLLLIRVRMYKTYSARQCAYVQLVIRVLNVSVVCSRSIQMQKRPLEGIK